MNFKPLNQQVIVLTGASSGIGLAAARAAAQRGAKLVLVSRNAEALQTIADQITSCGGEAMHVVADMGQRADLQRAGGAVIAHFGGFDTRVNNAGVSLYGRTREVGDEDHQRLFQTNFWGVVFGSRVAVAPLKPHGGALINLGSVRSDSAVPRQGMYSAIKHAVTDQTRGDQHALSAAGEELSFLGGRSPAAGLPTGGGRAGDSLRRHPCQARHFHRQRQPTPEHRQPHASPPDGSGRRNLSDNTAKTDRARARGPGRKERFNAPETGPRARSVSGPGEESQFLHPHLAASPADGSTAVDRRCGRRRNF